MDHWSSHRILAEVRSKGISLSQLGLQRGLKAQTLVSALQKPNSRAEEIIAEFLDVPAHVLWPDRYLPTGERRRPQPVANYRPKRRFPDPSTIRKVA